MSRIEKLIQKILKSKDISYKEAEKVLLWLGFWMKVKGTSHHNFRKTGYRKVVTLTSEKRLHWYQIIYVRKALEHEGYK